MGSALKKTCFFAGSCLNLSDVFLTDPKKDIINERKHALCKAQSLEPFHSSPPLLRSVEIHGVIFKQLKAFA